MNDKIQDAIDTIAAQCENKRDVIDALGIIETELDNIQSKMKVIFRNVINDNPTDKHFTTAARACSIVGISIEEQKVIEKDVNSL